MLDNIVEKIPDAWFDWFGRFLPGCYALGIIVWVKGALPRLIEISIGSTALLFLGAYLIGHFAQPPTSYVLKKIEGRWPDDEDNYSKAKNKGVAADSLNKTSKAHAEGAGMLMCCFFSISANLYFQLTRSLGYAFIFWFMSVYFLLMSYERAAARHRKIESLLK